MYLKELTIMRFCAGLLLILCAILVFSGCITPDQWSAEAHARHMKMCSLSCGDDRMLSYDTWAARCKCRSTR